MPFLHPVCSELQWRMIVAQDAFFFFLLCLKDFESHLLTSEESVLVLPKCLILFDFPAVILVFLISLELQYMAVFYRRSWISLVGKLQARARLLHMWQWMLCAFLAYFVYRIIWELWILNYLIGLVLSHRSKRFILNSGKRGRKFNV